MAATTDSKTIVIVDDEIHNMVWMIDYLESKGFKVITCENLNEALDKIEKEIYRAVIVDLNIPALPPLSNVVEGKGGTYVTFPGLYAAWFARNRGYRDRQVTIYSVHKDPKASEEANILGCQYILKGRPKDIKKEIDDIVSYDPTVKIA